MILGHGIDIVELSEMEKLSRDSNFIRRCFKDCEIENIPDSHKRNSHLAGRYAAKEAVLKALGCGFGNGVAFTDVLINREDGSPPIIELMDGAKEMAERLNINCWHLSISHSQHWAIASALASRK